MSNPLIPSSPAGEAAPSISDHEIAAALRPVLHNVAEALVAAGRTPTEAFDDMLRVLNELTELENSNTMPDDT